MAPAKKPLSRFFALFLALALLVITGVAFYLIFLLNQTPVEVKKVRVTSACTASGILALILLIIIMFVFSAGTIARSFAGKAGLFSILILLCLGVSMGLLYAVLPKVKDSSSPDDISRAKLFCWIVASFGLFLLIIVLLRYIIRFAKQNKQKKEIKASLETNKFDNYLESFDLENYITGESVEPASTGPTKTE